MGKLMVGVARILPLCALLLALPAAASHPGKKPKHVAPPVAETPLFTLFINPDDPLLLKAESLDGTMIEYFGEKNAEGLATAFNAVHIESVTNGPTTILLDEQSRPVQIFAANGVTLKLNWQSATLVLVTAISADGTIQVSVSVDLTNQNMSQPTVSTSAQAAFVDDSIQRNPRDGIHVEAFTAPLDSQPSVQTLDQAVGDPSSLVTVNRCGAPVDDAIVTMSVIEPGQPPSSRILGHLTGPGQYSVSIPTQPSPGTQAEAICSTTEDVLDIGCDALEPLGPAGPEVICGAVAGAVDLALFGPTGEAVAIFVGCEFGLRATTFYCSTLGRGIPIPGGPSLAEILICDNITNVVDRFVQTEVTLTPFVSIPGVALLLDAPSQNAPASGPFPNFTINAGDIAIASFTTNPVDPAPLQSYVATAEITCAAPGTEVT
jgi:hypothetical protein